MTGPFIATPQSREPLACLRFRGPFVLEHGGWRTRVAPAPTVYRLRAWEADGDRPRRIARAGGEDELGILDIGESANGLRRIEDLLGAVACKPRSHRAGWEYSAAGYDFASVFPITNLRIDFLAVEGKALAEAIELALLEDYRWRFKDRPPLNGSAGKLRKVERWLRSLGREPRSAEGWLDLDGLLPAGE